MGRLLCFERARFTEDAGVGWLRGGGVGIGRVGSSYYSHFACFGDDDDESVWWARRLLIEQRLIRAFMELNQTSSCFDTENEVL